MFSYCFQILFYNKIQMTNKFYIILVLISLATALRYQQALKSHLKKPVSISSKTTTINGETTVVETTTYDDGTTSQKTMKGNQIPKNYQQNFGFKDSKQTTSQKIQAELKKHNQYRTKHNVPSLKLSSSLNKIAQAYADKLYRQSPKSGRLVHSGDKRYGENLYWKSVAPDGGEASQAWYNEIKDYRWDGKFSSATGHFTQLIWKNSTQVGFGYAGGYVVANYNPPGNYLGRFKENVLRPK